MKPALIGAGRGVLSAQVWSRQGPSVADSGAVCQAWICRLRESDKIHESLTHVWLLLKSHAIWTHDRQHIQVIYWPPKCKVRRKGSSCARQIFLALRCLRKIKLIHGLALRGVYTAGSAAICRLPAAHAANSKWGRVTPGLSK